jgi:hypothetical protein
VLLREREENRERNDVNDECRWDDEFVARCRREKTTTKQTKSDEDVQSANLVIIIIVGGKTTKEFNRATTRSRFIRVSVGIDDVFGSS